MSITRLIFKNLGRNKRRSGLTILSIAFSLFLLGTLLGILDLFYNQGTDDSTLRLAVRRSTSLAETLPASYEQKIRAVEGVRYVMPFTWFQGQYKGEEKNFFANFACDPRITPLMFRETAFTQDGILKFQRDKNAAIAGASLFRKFGWKEGDKVTLVSDIHFTLDGDPVQVDLQLVGRFTSREPGVEDQLFFRNDYFDEANGRQGQVGTFWIKVNNHDDIARVCTTIDEMFRNTSAETKTETEKAFGASFVALLGNVKFFIGSISAVVILTMLLVAACTMALSIRERSAEIAVLKTLGFNRRTVLAMLLGEGFAMSILGGLLGMIGGRLFFMALRPFTEGSQFPPLTISLDVAMQCMIAALALGFLSAIVPALAASRESVLSGLKRVA